MAELTERQLYARAYYAANAERIKAKKRDQYHDGTGKAKAPIVPPLMSKPKPTAIKPPVKPKSAQPKPISDEPDRPRVISARERIENLRMDRELGLLDEDQL